MHLRALFFALMVAASVSTANVLAAPQTQVLSSSTKPVSAAECALAHQGMAQNPAASAAQRAWGRSTSKSDCVLVTEVTTEVSPNSVSAWDGCYNRQSHETFTSRLWPYPTIASAYMNYGLCWTNTAIEVSWTSCWINTFIGYGAGQNYCNGAPTSAGSWCAAEDDWYFFVYSTPWWHINHGFRDTWQAPLYAVSFTSW